MKNSNNSKEYIEEALIELLKQKDISEIRVIDIVKKAGTCRATFYRNYLDINEVINNILKKIEIKINFKIDNDYSITNSLIETFKTVKENKRSLSILAHRKFDYKIEEMIFNLTFREITKLNVMNNIYQPYFFAGASSSVIIAWIKNNFNESPEEMAKLFYNSLIGYMKI